MASVFRLGLTGGIGSGKSTVAGILVELGAAVIDADAIAHAVTATGGPAIEAIRATFGNNMITPEGALDRQKMRALAFSHPHARQQLEAIVHPLVGAETRRQSDAAIVAGQRCLVFDVPLLVESSRWRSQVDAVLVVDCTEATQISRVMARSQLDAAAVQAIINTQAPRARRLQAADAVIFNDGIPLHVLRSKVAALATTFGLSLANTTAGPN